MHLPQSIRSAFVLVIGLAVGAVGAVLFRDSLPGAAGSAEERANQLELELKRAQNRIAALEESIGNIQSDGGVLQRLVGGRDGRRTVRDGLRDIGDDLRAGRPVTPDQIFHATQPIRHTLAPLFDRMRLRQQGAIIDSLSGEFARKYDLDPQQQAALREFFAQRAEEEAKRWAELMSSEKTTLKEFMRASQDVRPDAGLDDFMPSILSGEKLAQFQTERLNERAQRVQRNADMRVQRLDSIVQLTESQRDQVFGIMARSSKDYDPRMALEGAGGTIDAVAVSDPHEATLAVLTPDQRHRYEVEKQRRRERAAKDLEAIGLTLPNDWDMFEDFY